MAGGKGAFEDLRKIFSIIPDRSRRRGRLVALSIFLRAVLDFAGIVVFIPVLTGILEKGEGAADVLPVAAAAMAFILVKNILIAGLVNFRSRYVYGLYSDLSARLLSVFISRGLAYVRTQGTVDLANKVNAVTMTFVGGTVLALMNAMSSVFLLVIILAALFIYEPASTAGLVVVVGPVMLGWSVFLRKRLKNLGLQENSVRREQSRTVYELFRGFPDYVIYSAEKRQMEKFRSLVGNLGQTRTSAEAFSSASSGVMEMTVMLAITVLMLMSFHSGSGMSVTFGVFALSAVKILPAVRSLVSSVQTVQSSLYSAGILSELLSGNLHPDSSGEFCGPSPEYAGPAMDFRKDIRVDHVRFSYESGTGPVLDNLSLVVKKGEYVGICGESGAGKTTLFNLMTGLEFPEAGAVCVDGIPLTRSNSASWQKNIGYVPQDVFLVKGTFVENIAFGTDPDDVDRERVASVLMKVGLWQWVSSLPEGIDTEVAEAGSSVSGGQKQRLGIARALYRGASVLFMDEATSSVDPRAEENINGFISRLSAEENMTVIIIAHRKETLASCRRIIDLDELKSSSGKTVGQYEN